jgi:serine/threonine protein kinase
MAAENPEYRGLYGHVTPANTPRMVIKTVIKPPPHELQFISDTVVSATGNDRQRVATLTKGSKYVMPHLGFDLHTILSDMKKTPDKYKSINQNMLLLQIHKLLFQLVIFSYYNIIHCDIKLENIMYDMTSGLMTLIDFDFISKFTTPLEFSTVIKPRINTIIQGEKHFKPEIPPEFIPTDQESRMDYITQFYSRFHKYLTTTKKYGTNNNEIWGELIKLLVQNPSMIKPDVKSCKTFDSFSLSYSLLTFLSHLEKHYGLITSNEALDKTFTLLETMGELDVESRIDIITAYDQMNDIIKEIFPEYALIATHTPIQTPAQLNTWVARVNAQRIVEETKIIGENNFSIKHELDKYERNYHAKKAASVAAKTTSGQSASERGPISNGRAVRGGRSYSRKKGTRKQRTRRASKN